MFKLVRRLVHRSPIDLEVLDGLQHEVPGIRPDNYEANEDYTPVEYDENSNDGDNGSDGVGYNEIDPQQDPENIDSNDDEYMATILNPAGTNHDSPIS